MLAGATHIAAQVWALYVIAGQVPACINGVQLLVDGVEVVDGVALVFLAFFAAINAASLGVITIIVED